MNSKTKRKIAVGAMGFISGMGRTLDPLGALLGHYCDKKGKKAFFMGRFFDYYDAKTLQVPVPIDESSLEFRVGKRMGDVTGLCTNVCSYGIPQAGSILFNFLLNAGGTKYENFNVPGNKKLFGEGKDKGGKLKMGEKKVYITIDKEAKGIAAYSELEKSLDILGFIDAFVFCESEPSKLIVSYVKKKGDAIMSVGSPLEQEVPDLSEIYSPEKKRFDSAKLEAILKISPVGIIVPDKKWAKKLEKETKKLGYDFKRVYKKGFFF